MRSNYVIRTTIHTEDLLENCQVFKVIDREGYILMRILLRQLGWKTCIRCNAFSFMEPVPDVSVILRCHNLGLLIPLRVAFGA
jgi:hypothetical protein